MQRQQNLTAAAVSRKKHDSFPEHNLTAPSVSSPLEHSLDTNSLAEKIYRWSTVELDYRPESIDSKTRSHVRSIGNSRSQTASESVFCPQALVSLCEGPCVPIMEYLVENIKSRSAIQSSRSAMSDQDTPMDQGQKSQRILERQAKSLQSRDLMLAIVLKQREISEARERIKQQRQIHAVKDIHHKQSICKIRVLQEYETLFQRLRLESLEGNMSIRNNDSNHYAMKTTLDNTLEEVMRIIKLVAIDGAKSTQIQAVESLGAQDLYQTIQQHGDGTTFIVDTIKDLKERSILTVKSERQSQIQRVKSKKEKLEALELLQLFREHHVERVVQVESILNKIAACELEKEQLYSRMRFQAQRREQMKKAVPFLQELEETKAHLIGLGAALEFIQGEQMNLVERVISSDEQQLKLESMSKASRAAGQKTIRLQQLTRKLIEMVRINHQRVPHTAAEISGDITSSISEGLARLSDLAGNQGYTLEGDSKFLHNLTEHCQFNYAEFYTRVLLPPLLDLQDPDGSIGRYSENGLFPYPSWQEVSTACSASADQYILRLAEIQRHNAAHQLAVSKARESNIQMGRTKTEIVSLMNNFMKSLPKGKSTSNENEKNLSLDSLSSKFEGDVKDIANSFVRFEDDRYTTFQDSIQETLADAEVGDDIIRKIQTLVEDDRKLSESSTMYRESSSQPLHKRMRYIQ
ncbi:hypothetical protein BGZ49_001221 [Haplosporangium sp. Z 27]|nr:hypothetical protein BGZ49_001221 [Haplosporangium sp. Z 27]